MPAMKTLEAEKRVPGGNIGKITKSGKLPAVFYGRKDRSTPILVPFNSFMKVWKEVGETGIVKLAGEAGGDREVLIHDIQIDPIKNIPRHVDFYVYEKGAKLQVNVPVEFEGVSPAVKDLGGILIKVRHELELEAEPKDLPHKIIIDIAPLVDFKSQILVKDIKLPHGVTLITGAEEVLAAVSEPNKEEEEKPAEAMDLSAIEVEKKGKEVVEGEVAEPPKEGDNK